jgi:hypothetical protein
MRFVAKDRDCEQIASTANQHVLDQPSAGHAVADDDQTPRLAQSDS